MSQSCFLSANDRVAGRGSGGGAVPLPLPVDSYSGESIHDEVMRGLIE